MRQTERPQDIGRDRKRRGIPSAETLAVLTRYRGALRDELGDTLDALRGGKRPDLDTRAQLVNLAVKLARELATGSDITGPALGASSATRGKPPRLTARDRAALE